LSLSVAFRARVTFRESEATVILRGFIDESKNERFFVLGGYVLPDDRWTEFARDWKIVLAQRPAISYFHAADAEAGEGAFAGIQQPFRRMKILDLMDVIEKHKLVGLVSWIALDDWEELLLPRIRPGFENEYFPLFDWVIKEIFQSQLAGGVFDCSTSFTFDDRTDLELKNNLVKIHGRIREDATDSRLQGMLGASPDFEDDKTVVPLQASDLLVWHRQRELAFPDEDREVYNRVAATVHFVQPMDVDYLQRL
jgi:hypothetical protein